MTRVDRAKNGSVVGDVSVKGELRAGGRMINKDLKIKVCRRCDDGPVGE